MATEMGRGHVHSVVIDNTEGTFLPNETEIIYH